MSLYNRVNHECYAITTGVGKFRILKHRLIRLIEECSQQEENRLFPKSSLSVTIADKSSSFIPV